MATILAALFFAGVFAVALWVIVDTVTAQADAIRSALAALPGAAGVTAAARRPVRSPAHRPAPRAPVRPAIRAAA